METVNTPIFELSYNNKLITKDIKRFVKQIECIDNLHGKADELNIYLNDSTNIWKSDWFPSQGDEMVLKLGYNTSSLIDMGTYHVDMVSATHEDFVIGGQSLSIKKSKTEQLNTKTFEETTLKDIVTKIASNIGLNLNDKTEKITPNFNIKHITQTQQTDLNFLMLLAEDFGYIVKITGKNLVFYKLKSIFDKSPTISLSLKDLMYYSISQKSDGLYNSCQVTRYNNDTDKIVGEYKDPNIKNGSVLKIESQFCENESMANEIAKNRLYRKNSEYVTGTITVEGNPLIQAGVNIKLNGLHKLNGVYNVTTVKHTLSFKNGYLSTVSIKRVRE